MTTKLREAAEAGILLGVKLGLATIVSILILGFVAKDYIRVREGAEMGRASFEFIKKTLEEQQKAKDATSKP